MKKEEWIIELTARGVECTFPIIDIEKYLNFEIPHHHKTQEMIFEIMTGVKFSEIEHQYWPKFMKLTKTRLQVQLDEAIKNGDETIRVAPLLEDWQRESIDKLWEKGSFEQKVGWFKLSFEIIGFPNYFQKIITISPKKREDIFIILSEALETITKKRPLTKQRRSYLFKEIIKYCDNAKFDDAVEKDVSTSKHSCPFDKMSGDKELN